MAFNCPETGQALIPFLLLGLYLGFSTLKASPVGLFLIPWVTEMERSYISIINVANKAKSCTGADLASL